MRNRSDKSTSRRIAVTILASIILVSATASRPRQAARAGDLPAALVGPLPSAADVLARIAPRGGTLESYAVPVHFDVHLRKLFSFHFGLNGTQYFKHPDHLALDMREVPPNARRVFSQIGTPMTWADTYEMRTAGAASDGIHTTYRLEGVPKRAGEIDRMILDVDTDPSRPLRAQWFCHGGTTIATVIDEQPAGPYRLPKHGEVDLSVAGYKVHVVIDYGDYNVNAQITDSVFSGA